MNPIFQAVISSIFRLKRTCSKCKRDQVVPTIKRKAIVCCKFCGADIPPRL